MKKQFFLTMMLLVLSATGIYADDASTEDWTDCSTYMEVQQAYRAGKKYIRLTADIDMSTEYNKKEFKDFLDDDDTKSLVLEDCIFDGQNHTIKGMIYTSTKNYIGFFRKAKNSTFRNVKFNNPDIDGRNYVAALCAYAVDCKFDSITISGNDSYVFASTDLVGSGGYDVGGIVAILKGGSITNCTVRVATLYAHQEYGGIVGYATDANIENCTANCGISHYGSFDEDNFAGGIVGKAIDCSVTNCISKGSLDCNLANVGGIAGYASNVKFSACVNNASVYTSGYDKYAYCAGITGFANYQCSIINCTNNGEVKGKGYYIGGIAGSSACSITNCVNNGNVTNEAATYDDYVGGISGYFKGNITYCTNNGVIAGDSFIGGIAGATVREEDNTTCAISNCLQTGTVYGEGLETGGIIGCADKYTNITRCISSGDVYRDNKICNDWCYGIDKDKSETAPNVSYCLYTANSDEDADNNVLRITQNQLASGYATCFMEGNGFYNNWRQNIDNGKTPDNKPVICYTAEQKEEHDLVYGYSNCFNEDAYSNTPHDNGHNFLDGVCTICGYPEDGTTKQINNMKDFVDFTTLTNRGINLNGQLNTDITLDKDCDWTATIGNSEDTPYTGIFSGNGHTITLNYSEAGDFNPQCGFENVKDATIAKLMVKGDVLAKNAYASGLVHYTMGDQVNINSCVSFLNITSTLDGDASYGGLVAVNEAKRLYIRDCMYAGIMDLGGKAYQCGGFIGYNKPDCEATIQSCIMAGILENAMETDNLTYTFVRNENGGDYYVITSYYSRDWGNDAAKGTKISTDDLYQGKMADLLINWRQDLTGYKSYPLPMCFNENITHTCTFTSNNFDTVCLPYDFAISENSDSLTFYKPTGVDLENKAIIIEAYGETETITAGTPVLAERKSDTVKSAVITCNSRTFTEPASIAFATDWTFYGSYNLLYASSLNSYIFEMDKVCKPNTIYSYSDTFHATFKYSGKETISLPFTLKKAEETGIHDINVTKQSAASAMKVLTKGGIRIIRNGKTYDAAGAAQK